MYRAAGVEDRCGLVMEEGGDRFDADAAWPVMKAYIKEEIRI